MKRDNVLSSLDVSEHIGVRERERGVLKILVYRPVWMLQCNTNFETQLCIVFGHNFDLNLYRVDSA